MTAATRAHFSSVPLVVELRQAASFDQVLYNRTCQGMRDRSEHENFTIELDVASHSQHNSPSRQKSGEPK